MIFLMKKITLKKSDWLTKRLKRPVSLVLFAFFMLLLVAPAQAQIYAPEGLNMPGTWNGWTNPPANNLAFASSTQVADGRVLLIDVGTLRWQTTFSVAATGGDITGGTYTWLFTSGPESNAFANKWADVTVSMNSLQEYTYQGAADNSLTVADGYWYTMNWEDAGYGNTRAIFMETSAEPVAITSVSVPATVLPNEDVVIGVTTDAAPSPEELVYLRYTTTAWNTSEVLVVAMTGVNGVATIPGQPDNTTVDYYVFTSTVAGITSDFDLYTIKYNNNGNSNYQYVVGGGAPPVIGWANLQWPDMGIIVTGSEYLVYGQVFIPGVTDQAGQGADVQAWIGYHNEDTDPAGWTNWIVADFSGDVGNNDEYVADLGTLLTDEGTYYYATKFQYLTQQEVYGGFSAFGGGFWDGITNVSGMLTVTGTPPDPEIGWANLQYPGSGTIEPGQEYIVYAQAWIADITGQVDPAVGLQSWIGFSLNDTDPATWTDWIPASYFGAAGSNDEFIADLGAQMVAPGTYYYASRFQYLDQEFVYGGYSTFGGGFWDGVANVSGVLTVMNEVITYPVTFAVTDATGLYSNIKFKGSMTDWEPVDMIQNNDLWSVTLDIYPGDYEWGVFEDDGSPLGIWLVIGPNLTMSVSAEGIVTGDTTYLVTFVGIEETRALAAVYPNPTSDFLTVSVADVIGTSDYYLVNSSGSVVYTGRMTSGNQVVDLRAFPAGMYVLVVKQGKAYTYSQVIKN